MEGFREPWQLIWITIAIIIIIVLVVQAYNLRDCINGKKSKLQPEIPEDDEEFLEYISKLREHVRVTSQVDTWRAALLVSLFITFFVVYLMKGDWPNLTEYLLTALFIFLGTYFALSWNQVHYVDPNLKILDRKFQNLEERLSERSSTSTSRSS